MGEDSAASFGQRPGCSAPTCRRVDGVTSEQPVPFRRDPMIERLGRERLDLLIGGAITDVGGANDATARGLSVALVERDDFASGNILDPGTLGLPSPFGEPAWP